MDERESLDCLIRACSIGLHFARCAAEEDWDSSDDERALREMKSNALRQIGQLDEEADLGAYSATRTPTEKPWRLASCPTNPSVIAGFCRDRWEPFAVSDGRVWFRMRER